MSIACNFAGYCRPGASGQQRRGRGRACMHERALRHIRRLSIEVEIGRCGCIVWQTRAKRSLCDAPGPCSGPRCQCTQLQSERRAERVEVVQALPVVFHEASDTISDLRRHVCNLRHNRKPLRCSAAHPSSLSCSLPNQPLAFPLLDLQPALRQFKHALAVVGWLRRAAGGGSASLHIGSRLTLAQAHVTALLVPAWA